MSRAEKISSNLEEKTLNTFNEVRRTLDNNSRYVILGGLGLFVANWAGWVSLGLPDWWPLAAGAVLSSIIAAYIGGQKVAELIPEKDGIWLVTFTVDDGTGGQIWEIHEEDWADMTVDGELYEWSESPLRLYEARSYDPEENHAVANWRESKPASELAAEQTVDDALAAIRDLRETLEPEAAKAREMRRRIRGITRQLDRQRAQELDKAIDEATIDADMDEATISNVLDNALPDDLHPHAGGGDEGDESDERDGWRDEPMVTIEDVNNQTDPLAGDD